MQNKQESVNLKSSHILFQVILLRLRQTTEIINLSRRIIIQLQCRKRYCLPHPHLPKA